MITALATTGTETTTNPYSSLISIGLIVVMLLVFYFLIIRPQKKQDKKIADMREGIKVGDEIVTIGGIIGTVLIAKDDKLMIETGNDKAKLTILRSAVKGIYGEEETK